MRVLGEKQQPETENDNSEIRLARLEAIIQEEINARLRAEHDFRHRLFYLEKICLIPMLGQQMRAQASWLSRLRGWFGLVRFRCFAQ